METILKIYCPHCGTELTNNDVLDFNENTGRLTYVCPFCDREIDEDDTITE